MHRVSSAKLRKRQSPGCTLIEPIGEKKEQLRKVYEGDLMLNGGHLAGWAVEDPELVEQIMPFSLRPQFPCK